MRPAPGKRQAPEDPGDGTAPARPGRADEAAGVAVVEAQRAGLLRLAYSMVGVWGDADDLVQAAYERWYRLTPTQRAGIDRPGAWLRTAASRLCLTHLDSARVRRERYVGPWLPEPLPAHHHPEPGPLEQATVRESVDMALLVVLETLTPAQRVAYVLHEVFGVPYTEIAEILARSPAATRQLATAARRHLHDTRTRPAGATEHARLVAAFRHACEYGDLEELIRVLDPQVTSISDGGGMTGVARRPITGADKVARFLLGSLAKRRHTVSVQDTEVNGRPGLAIISQAPATPPTVIGIVAFDTTPGCIRQVWITMNPDKLRTWNTPRPDPHDS